MLPDDIYVLGKKIHVAWLSGIWIHPDYRQKTLGTQLHKAAYEAWNGLLEVTEFTPLNRRTILGTQLYDTLPDIQGIKIYFFSSFASYFKTKNSSKMTLAIGSLADRMINGINAIKNLGLSLPSILAKWTYTEENDLSADGSSFINQYEFYSSFNRRSEDFSWILHYPWIGNDQNSFEELGRYYFSVYCQEFYLKVLNVYYEGQLRGVIFINLRDDVAKIPYIFADIMNIDEISRIIINYLNGKDIAILISYHDEWNSFLLKYSRKRCYYKNTRRYYLAGKNLLKLIDKSSLLVQAGDGNNIFV